MKLPRYCKAIGIALLLCVGLAACDKPGPAESAGKRIDQTADNAGRKLGAAADKAGKTISEAADKIGEKLDQEGAKTAATIDDAEITAKVKASIFAEPGLRTLQISVDTVGGVVTLSGSVDSVANSDRARELAGAVAGVKQVHNKLVAKSIK